MTETLSTCGHIEPWAARAAGLVFAQYFWFRHCFLLTGQQGQLVQQLVVTMLSDKKLEVQDLAASSLSGFDSAPECHACCAIAMYVTMHVT